ncbi:MAG: hemin uptake protein HemP [Candidatus Tectomicrobia bacterium]|nr:hemin uptake protein HemP [Candidatus Tectomicrobia bacterium]
MSERPVSPERAGRPPVQGATPREDAEVLDVQQILRGRKRVSLLHGGEVYRLQVTKHGRLLLTK